VTIGLPTPRPADYWTARFADDAATDHHRRHAETLAQDFLAYVKRAREYPAGPGGRFNAALRGAHSVIEIGCGTGELARLIDDRYCPAVTYATDPDLDAVRMAQRLHPKVRFELYDIVTDWPTHLGNFSVAVACDVLQHFAEPLVVLDRLLTLADMAIVVVPYRQPLTKTAFKGFRVRDSFVFQTRTSSVRQLALLLAAK
jgi:trans-aconitate methyltransferase